MTKKEARNKAIDRVKGRIVMPGAVVGTLLNPLTHEFVRLEGDQAVCQIKPGEEVRFPMSEVFDVKQVVNVANHYLNLGFWEEGMESMILTIGEKGVK